MKNIARPYIAIASISTTKSSVRPNISGFSAIAPIAAALAVPRPMPAPHDARPAAIPAPIIKSPEFDAAEAACVGPVEKATTTIDEIVTTPIPISKKLSRSRFDFTSYTCFVRLQLGSGYNAFSRLAVTIKSTNQ